MAFRAMILIAMLTSAPALAGKPAISAADVQSMSGYALSMDTLGKYARAIAAMDAACKDDRRLQEQAEESAMHPGESLEQAIKRVGKSPLVARYFQPAGLEARDVGTAAHRPHRRRRSRGDGRRCVEAARSVSRAGGVLSSAPGRAQADAAAGKLRGRPRLMVGANSPSYKSLPT